MNQVINSENIENDYVLEMVKNYLYKNGFKDTLKSIDKSYAKNRESEDFQLNEDNHISIDEINEIRNRLIEQNDWEFILNLNY